MGFVTPHWITCLGSMLRLRRNARLTREQFEAERLERFQTFIRHVQQRSPYYATVMRQRGIEPATCQPADFPILTKRLLQENFDDICTDRRITRAGITDFLRQSRDPEQRYLGEFMVLHTSGSSGEVGYFVFSAADWMRGMAGLARVRRLGPRRTRLAFYGATGGHFAGVSWSVTARRGLLRLFYDMITLDINAPLAETLARLNGFQPQVIIGYGTGHKILAEAQLAGRLKIAPGAIESGGEPLSPGDQAWLEEVFGCPCINVYGATETMLMGVARSGEPGMTLFDDDLIVEPAADHLLVTNLFNHTLPLIRYRMGDTLRLTKSTSPYGHYPVIAPVVGRNEWVPTFRNRCGELDFISPHIINEIFVPGVWRLQMRWLDESRFRLAVCLNQELDTMGQATAISAIKARLREILGQKGLDNVWFAVDVVDDIPVDPQTRKFRLILRVERGGPGIEDSPRDLS